MFGLSITKLLVLALIVLAVWYGFKWWGLRSKRRAEGAKADGKGKPTPRAPAAEDLVHCPACGTYAPTQLATCPSGRGNCPLITS